MATHRSASFASRIAAWQRRHGRHDLPWQRTTNPYRIWLAEIMLQQTQVATVVPYYQRFVASFPDVASLASALPDRVLEHWAGLGYYRRAHHLHAAARGVVDKNKGAFPEDVEAIAALPGIGRSTAAAIAVFAFGRRAAILDGNVKRVIARHRGIEGFPGASRVERALWSAAEALLPANDIEAYTQGLMDLGATICTRSAPACSRCPVAADCIALAQDRVADFPSPRPARKIPQRTIRVLVIERSGEILFQRRPPTGVWAGLWSLPELPLEADVREGLRARFGAEVATSEPLAPIVHGFTHFTLTLHPQRIAVSRWPTLAEAPGVVWLTRADALSAALPAPIKRLVKSL